MKMVRIVALAVAVSAWSGSALAQSGGSNSSNSGSNSSNSGSNSNSGSSSSSSSSSGMSADSMRQPGGLYDATPHTRKTQLSVWGLGSWYWGIGAGARYQFPLLADGFLADFNDSVEFEFGGDFYFFGYGFNTLDIPAEAMWSFHVFPNLDLYAKVSVGLSVELTAAGAFFSPLFNIAPGVSYKLSDSMVVRAELGYRGLRAGIGFVF